MKLKNQLLSLIKYAIQAPSGYNTQPWKFKLSPDTIEILPDYTRARLSTDPEYREFFMSLGAAAFNLELAAKHFGFSYQKSYLINSKKQENSILFTFDGRILEPEDSPLFDAIPNRHTNRFPYLDQKIPKDFLTELKNLPRPDFIDFHLVTRPGDITTFSRLIDRSFSLWYRQQALVEELESWLRDDLEFSPDGLPSGVINLYKLAINFKYFLHPDDPEIKRRSTKSQQLAKKAPALAIISTQNDSISQWFAAGEFFELLSLTLASRGYTTDFFNYPLTLKKTRQETAEILSTKHLPQLLFRLGQPTFFPPRTPRRPLREVVISTH